MPPDTIPRQARPHEVAILEKLFLGWEPKRVASWFHYGDTTPVYKVKMKYITVVVKREVCPEAHPDERACRT